MHYEINVTFEGQHFFATSERSITSLSRLVMVASVLRYKFPESQGFNISLTRWENTGKTLELSAAIDQLKRDNSK